MASAHVIEVGEITAGIVVFEQGGFRFFASERPFHALEGALFRSADQAERAARERLRPRSTVGHGQGRERMFERRETAMPNPDQDRALAIADFICEFVTADRDALVCSIVSRWPDATGDEIERAIELAPEQIEG
jgi:hypothetical protein